MKITLQMLDDRGACYDQVARFKRHFGQGVVVTRARCLSVASIFNWSWAVDHLLLRAGRKAYYKAISLSSANKTVSKALFAAEMAYAEANAAARKAYAEATVAAAALAAAGLTALAYDEAISSAEMAYDEANAAARKAYNKAYGAAQKEYDRACATAFWKASRK